jgi:hypothetical protein
MREFEQVLAWLRGLAWPCAPPIGVGEFEVLYASDAEVVVWYSPAREGHRTGEVAIPCARLVAAWRRLTAGDTLDAAALDDLGAGPAGGRWLLALLAQLPGARVQPEPLALAWAPAPEPVRDTAQIPRAPRQRRSSAANDSRPAVPTRPRRSPSSRSAAVASPEVAGTRRRRRSDA